MPVPRIKNKDGTYDNTFATQYIIKEGPLVYRLGKPRPLKPDDKNRVTLSCGGHTRRVNVERLWSNTMEYQLYPGDLVTSNEGTIDVQLGPYTWRIPADAEFAIDMDKHHLRYIPYRAGGDAAGKFIDLLVKPSMQNHEPNQCTYRQLADWLPKYGDATDGLPEAYDLYRYLPPCPTMGPMQLIVKLGDNHFYTHKDGYIVVSSKDGMVSLRPETRIPSKYASTLLANNRLTFTETNSLISGPFTPLLTWAACGIPWDTDVLFNISGNKNDFSAHNYTWVPKRKLQTYTQFRTWITRRWRMENPL